jgi:hypothetical protein
MKKSLLFLVFVLLVSANLSAQGKKVYLNINHLLNGSKLEYMKAVKSPNTPYYFKVELLRYYLSEIKITHDGGKIDVAKDIWILANPAKGYKYDLGTFDVKNIEAIELGLGVDEAHNHLDPTKYETKHPLAMQSPSMHWGWSSGYRFITFEGYAGANEATANINFQIHTLDDVNYKTVKIPTGATAEGSDLVITLNAEYSNLLKNIDATSGSISHGSTGDAATQMVNLATSVFTAAKTTGTQDVSALPIAVYPNPAKSQVVIHASMQNVESQEVVITNMIGQTVLKAVKNTETLNLPLSLSAGNYMISILENGKTVGREKLQIVE